MGNIVPWQVTRIVGEWRPREQDVQKYSSLVSALVPASRFLTGPLGHEINLVSSCLWS